MVVSAAEEAGMDAIAITDHNTMSAVGLAIKAARTVVIIPGMEITTSRGTHVIGLFLNEEIVSRDFREVIDEIHEQGGLAVLPHPFRKGSGLMYAKDKQGTYSADEAREIMQRIDLAEIINFSSDTDELINANNFFSSHPDLPQVAGSDSHRLENIGKAYVDLEKVNSIKPGDIKKALLKSARTIRYEAYQAESRPEIRQIQIATKRKTIIRKTMDLIRFPVRKSIQSIYRKSTRKIFGNTILPNSEANIRENK